jgi:hypothetical protein
LYESRHTYFRLEREENEEYFGVWLYRTELARFYKPDPATGNRKVCYDTYYSQTTNQFMWEVLNISSRRPTFEVLGEGRTVYCPLVPSDNRHDWAAELTLDMHGNLIIGQSKHIPVGLRCSDDSDKNVRKEKRDEVRPLLDLARLQVPTMVSQSNPAFNPDLGYMGSFSSSFDSGRYFNSHNNGKEFLYREHARKPMAEWEQSAFDEFNNMCQHIACAYVSRIAVNKGFDWEAAATWVAENPSGLIKAIENKLLESARLLQRKSGVRDLGQFPEKLPKACSFVRMDNLR